MQSLDMSIGFTVSILCGFYEKMKKYREANWSEV